MNAMRAILGIDPGKKGGICLVYSDGSAPVFWPIPVKDDGEWADTGMALIANALKSMHIEVSCIIEQAHAFPPSMGGGIANFSIGEGYGMMRGALATAGIPIEVVPAGTWRKQMGVKVDLIKTGMKMTKKGMKPYATQADKDFARSERKRVSLECARMLSGLPFKTPRGRDLDGEAEAYLIAKWGLRTYEQPVRIQGA